MEQSTINNSDAENYPFKAMLIDNMHNYIYGIINI